MISKFQYVLFVMVILLTVDMILDMINDQQIKDELAKHYKFQWKINMDHEDRIDELEK